MMEHQLMKSFTTTSVLTVNVASETMATRIREHLDSPEVTQKISEDLNAATQAVLNTWLEMLKQLPPEELQ